MRVSNERVAISQVISTPSRVLVPQGKREFVVFRQDLANITPDRATLRFITQVVRALTFAAGSEKPTSDCLGRAQECLSGTNGSSCGQSGNASPSSGPGGFGAAFWPHVLVLKGAGYDFTVDGSGTDETHCLERTDALVALRIGTYSGPRSIQKDWLVGRRLFLVRGFG
jgi:hypothetical protein